MGKCRRLGCVEDAVEQGNCKRHASATLNGKVNPRPSYRSLYNTAQWKRMRKNQLNQQPLCECCRFYGYLKPAIDVDHIYPHRGDRALFFDSSNLSSMCKKCHAYKTAEETKGIIYDYRNNSVLDTQTGTSQPIRTGLCRNNSQSK